MLRSVLSVVTGFVAAAVVVMTVTLGAAALLRVESGQPTPPYLVLNLLGSAGGAALGGYTTTRIAGRAPRVHALALAAVMLALTLPAVFSPPTEGQPGWYAGALVVLRPVFVMLGSILASPVDGENASS